MATNRASKSLNPSLSVGVTANVGPATKVQTVAPAASPVYPGGSATFNEGPTSFTENMPALQQRFFKGQGAPNTPMGLVSPSPLPLDTIEKHFGELAANLKEQLQARQRETPLTDQQASKFWQGFNSYPDAMSHLIVRRAWTNQMTAQGPVSEWMDFLGKGK